MRPVPLYAPLSKLAIAMALAASMTAAARSETLPKLDDIECPNEAYCELIKREHVDQQLILAKQFADQKDPGNAKDWFGRAANSGSQEALVTLAFMYTEQVWLWHNPPIAETLFNRAKAMDEGRAEYLMGMQYIDWSRRLDQPELAEKAAGWFQQAAGHNDPEAKARLASTPAH